MEALVASAIGVMTAAGIYMILRLRTFPVIVGTALLSYAVNVFLFASGRLAMGLPPVIMDGRTEYADPLPQALVLTAIVISFGMTATVVLIALGAYLESGTDRVDTNGAPADGDESGAADAQAVAAMQADAGERAAR
jgi:multicomponent K+:H+ antiporter subunit C